MWLSFSGGGTTAEQCRTVAAAQKTPVLQKGRGYKLVLPPLFTDHSHGLPLRVSDNTQALVTCAATSQPTITSPQKERSCKLGVKLGDVFELRFRCASHQPATFCISLCPLLLLFIAFFYYLIIFGHSHVHSFQILDYLIPFVKTGNIL